MHSLSGLLVGFALLAQPAMAQKPDKEAAKEERAADKEERAADKLERKALQPAARPAPEPEPEPVPEPEPEAEAEPDPTPEPVAVTAEATPAPTAVPHAGSSPPTPASAAAPRRARPARPRRRTAVPQPQAAAIRAPAPIAAPRATATPAPTATPRAGSAWVRREAATVTRPPVAVEAVTRVVRVIPAPLRVALGLLLLAVVGFATRARRLKRERRGLRQDLGLLQSALLPVLPRRIGGAEVSAAYRPAEGLAAGGDFYDAFALGDRRTCVLVGDVAGHGRDAIPLTADVRFTLRAYLEGGLAPRAALAAAAGVLEPRLQGRTVTVIVALYDAQAGTLTYATAGHPPPLLLGVDERLLTAGGCPALGSGVPTALRQTTVALPPSATAIFHTDGLTDILRHGRRMGRAGLTEAVRPGEDAGGLLERLFEGATAQPDDMAACVLRPAPGATAAPPGRVEELHVEGDPARAEIFLRACGVAGARIPSGSAVLEVRDGELAVRTADHAVLPLG